MTVIKAERIMAGPHRFIWGRIERAAGLPAQGGAVKV
jgi:hypothetical protein